MRVFALRHSFIMPSMLPRYYYYYYHIGYNYDIGFSLLFFHLHW